MTGVQLPDQLGRAAERQRRLPEVNADRRPATVTVETTRQA